MGQLFGGSGLTQPGSQLQDPSGQTAIGSPDQVLTAADRALKAKTQASQVANLSGSPDTMNTGSSGQLPTIGTPSFLQASQSGAPVPGGANVMSPGLNKAGKLVTLLTAGLQGAMAGRARSEETVAATGGRRSGGAGMGFEAGYTLPWQRAGMQNQLEQQQAQTGVLKSEAANVDVPGVGSIPGWLAKTMGPAGIRAAAAENVQGQKGAQGQALQQTKNEGGLDKQALANTGNTDVAKIQQGAALPVDETVANLAGIPEMANQPVGKGTWDNINKLLAAKGYKTQDLANEGLWLIDRGGNKIKRIGESPSMARVQNRAVQVGDPNSPGNTKYETAGQAIREGAAGTQSASVQVPKRAAASEVPTKIGDQRIAFTTMIQHADLLREAARALSNRDTQTLAGLKNAFKNEFGYSGPVTAQAIADAYAGEVTNVIAKGHMTEGEMAKTGRTVNPQRQNFATIDGVLNAYQSLAKSKMDMLDKQEKAAVDKSQKKNNAAPSTSGSSDLVNQLIQKHAPTASPAAK